MTSVRADGGRPPLLRARGLTRRYGQVPALDQVDLDLDEGETVGLVGRSGSGKSTLVRLLLAVDRADAGELECRGTALRPGRVGRLRPYRRLVQVVPQDAAASLDPRARVIDIVREPLLRLGVPGTAAVRHDRARTCLRLVGLPDELHDRRPHELSGGQAQRVAIARALAPAPRLLIADEPVAGLDPPLRAVVVETLAAVTAPPAGAGLLLVSHDLSVVARLCGRTVVLDGGRIVEDRPTADLLAAPRHPVTRALLDAVPLLPA